MGAKAQAGPIKECPLYPKDFTIFEFRLLIVKNPGNNAPIRIFPEMNQGSEEKDRSGR